MQDFKEYQIWNGVTPKAITSSTNATPTVLTVSSHGFSTGDVVQVFGHTVNTAANGCYKITVLSSNTFSLQDINTGANVAGNGTGAATGSVVLAPKVVLSQEYDSVVLEVGTSGSANMTVKVLGSQGDPFATLNDQHGDTPNFGATISATNNYSYLQLINNSDSTPIDGSTGVVFSGVDAFQSYKINVEAMKYITLCISTWTAGAIYAKLTVYKN